METSGNQSPAAERRDELQAVLSSIRPGLTTDIWQNCRAA